MKKDLISRQAAIDEIKNFQNGAAEWRDEQEDRSDIWHRADSAIASAIEIGLRIKKLPSAPRWIPVTERLPENTEPVNITWVNRKPDPYYSDIKDKPFTATGHYCNGRWWWYSSVCQDYLDEYGECEMDEMDGDIEVLAWMPLPEPWKGEDDD